METPLLFGIDPDETWDFVPASVRGIVNPPTFLLKAPSLSASIKRERFLARAAEAANAAEPEAAKRIASGEETDNDRLAWLKAWEKFVQDHADEEAEITALYIREGVAGWRNLPSRTGRPIDYEANKGRILEVLRGFIVTEICNAIAAGATLSNEEQVGLPSSQESQSA